MSNTERPEIDAVVDLFVHGAKTLSVGSYLNDNKVCLKGLAIIREAVGSLDRVSGARPAAATPR